MSGIQWWANRTKIRAKSTGIDEIIEYFDMLTIESELDETWMSFDINKFSMNWPTGSGKLQSLGQTERAHFYDLVSGYSTFLFFLREVYFPLSFFSLLFFMWFCGCIFYGMILTQYLDSHQIRCAESLLNGRSEENDCHNGLIQPLFCSLILLLHDFHTFSMAE